MNRTVLARLAEAAQKEADEALRMAAQAYRLLLEARQATKMANARAAELLKHATRLRIQHMRSLGAKVEEEGAEDGSI